SWSIPSEDPYEEAAQQLLEQAPRSPEYVPDPIELEDHVPSHIPEHPEDLIPEADTPPRKRILLIAPRPGCEVGESSAAAAARQPGPTMARSKDRAAVRAKIEVLRREILAYEQESIQTREALARSEAYSRALEARVAVLETQARRHKWQRQTADDLAVQHIMRTQALRLEHALTH
nr:hypothetical protein [Tanacetum cinerariifolium]